MSNERIMILKMLEDGKISSEEAAKLLASLPQADSSVKGYDNLQNKAATPEREGNWARDFGRKVEIIAKDLEPKIQKFTEVVVEKTSHLAEKISQSLASPPPAPKPAKPIKLNKPTVKSTPTPIPSKNSKLERSFEYIVSSSELNEFNATCLNGYIFLKGYHGDKITAKVIYEPRTPNPSIELLKLGSTYYLNYDNEQFKNISIEAYIPSSLFKKLQLETSNDKITLDSLNCDKINLLTQHGDINLKNIVSDNLKAETSNGKISVNNLTGAFAAIENYNGSVDAVSIDTATLKLDAANSPVTVLILAFTHYSHYQWRIQTSNAKLKINVPTTVDTAYDLKAYTSLSEVIVGLTGLNYIQNDKNYIEAKSLNIDSAFRKIRLELDTSNAPLSLNS